MTRRRGPLKIEFTGFTLADCVYDEKNRRVRSRELSGRADPSRPVTDTENRPTGKLRPEDPDFFETRCQWNADSLLTRTVFPEKNVIECVYEAELDPAARRRSQGNLRQVRRLSGPRGGAQVEIVERFEYDPLANQVVRAVDPLGNESRCDYDGHGNLVRFTDRIPTSSHDFEYNEFGQLTAQVGPDNGSGQRRREEYEYHGPAAGAQNGYLKRVRLRLTPIDSEVGIETDAVGNVVQVTDPRGHVWTYDYNTLDELVRVTSPTLPTGVPHTVVWDTFRDLNGNAVRQDVRNVSHRGSLAANTHLSRVYEYDALNRLVRKHEEVGSANLGPGDRDGSSLPASEFITTEYEYDAAGNLALVRPEGAPGEPVNVVRQEHDERDRLFRRTRGAGSAGESTDQIDYDGNGNRVVVYQGGQRAVGRLRYDGYDRMVRAEDALGNAAVLEHDANGRVVVRFALGDSTGDPAGVKVKLQHSIYEYDAMDRRRRLHILTEPANPASDRVVTEYSWSDASQLRMVVDPNGHETRYTYDAACRLQAITDALGNSSTLGYDTASNRISRTDAEMAMGAVSAFETRYDHDPLDRRVQMADSLGNTLRYAHDSRSNLTEVVNARGDSTVYDYDGMGRLTAARRALGPLPSPEIVDRLRWDSSSRLVEEIDPNANVIRHAYDALDRRVSTTFADGTVHRFAYDVRDNPVEMTDANGTLVTCTYDLLDRLSRKDIKPGPGVSSATTFEEFRHDGLSRLLSARNDASTATFSYDSLSRVTRETLDGRTTGYSYDPAGNLFAMGYPGGTGVRYEYDALNRLVSAGNGTNCCDIVKSTEYAGPGRMVSRSLGNGDNSNWFFDGARRVTRALHEGGTPPVAVSDRGHAWDAMYRQVGRGDLLGGGIAHEYTYDGAHRLIQSTFAVPGTPPRETIYTLDPAGNRTEVAGAVDPGRYFLDPTLPVPADFQVNQYTATPFDQRLYDENGNLLRFGRPTFGRIVEVAGRYDYAGRLVEVEDPATGETVSFTYDALGRRSSSTVGGVAATRSYHGMKLIEDARRGALYIYAGSHPIVVQSGGQNFLLRDGVGNVAAVTDSQGSLIETYEYGDFGLPRIFDPAGNPSPASKIGNPFLRDELEYDGDTGLYYSPAAGVHFDPRAGRNVNGKYRLQSGFIYSSQTQRAGIPGHGNGPGVSDFGMSRRVSLRYREWHRLGAGRAVPVPPLDPGLDSYTDPFAIQEGGKNDGAHKRPGPTRFSHICLKRGVTKSKAFFNWVASAANREVKRMSGKIALCKREGSPMLEWTFEKGWPCRYEGPRFDSGSGQLAPWEGLDLVECKWAFQNGYPVKWEGPELDASKNEISIDAIEIAHHGFGAASRGGGGGGSGGLSPVDGRVPIRFALFDPEADQGVRRAREGTLLSKPPYDSSLKRSDNGWGNCFNCHPFGLADGVRASQRDSEQFQSLTNVQKSKHDAAMAAIQNTR